ncbi:MAG: hypothetical protein GXX92_10240, partial [Clostridiales bacterium]|nr:hypothetical protein [Clostridiales bacterium]
KVRKCIDEEGKTAVVESEAVGLERVKEAEQLGVTPGKLNLVEKLVKSSPVPEEIIIEEWLDKPVKEINKLIKENKKALKEQEKADREKDKHKDKENGKSSLKENESGKGNGEKDKKKND